MGVAIVAVALNPIRHGGEAKPYAVDFLASTVLLALLVEWWRRPDRPTWVWVLAASTPIVMGLSLPSVFVLGGISLAMLGRISGRTDPGLAWSRLTSVSTPRSAPERPRSSFWNRAEAGAAEVKACMDHYWSSMFPPLGDPARLVPLADPRSHRAAFRLPGRRGERGELADLLVGRRRRLVMGSAVEGSRTIVRRLRGSARARLDRLVGEDLPVWRIRAVDAVRRADGLPAGRSMVWPGRSAASADPALIARRRWAAW